MKRCPSCQQTYPDNASDFCPSDGARLVGEARTIKRCPTCNQTFDESGPNFCPQDGTPVVTELPPSFSAPPPPSRDIYSDPPPPPPYGSQGYNAPYPGQGYGAPGFGNQPYGMQPGGNFGMNERLWSVGEKREPAMVILFTILTCGIYGFWWYHTYATETKNALGRQDLNPTKDLILTFVTCGIWGIIAFYYNYPKLFVDLQRRAGLPPNDISTTTLLLGILFAPASIYIIQSELNKIWDAAGGGRR
ncbi:MAG TPA: DUF4234 domain-containing protein [Pyrinomonadaceae bacterium]|jgi:hypothetical protein